MVLKSELSQIGLTDGEIKVYMALLKHGSQTRNGVTKHSKVSNSKVYSISDRLIEKGLVSTIKRNEVVYLQANSPEMLERFVEKKENDILKQKQIIQDLLPKLIDFSSDEKDLYGFEVFEGWRGVKNAEIDAITSMSIGGLIKGVGSQLPRSDFLREYHKIRLKKKITANVIATGDYPLPAEHEGIEFRRLTDFGNIGMGIYQDRITVESYDGDPVVVVVKHPVMISFFENMFNVLWNISYGVD